MVTCTNYLFNDLPPPPLWVAAQEGRVDDVRRLLLLPASAESPSSRANNTLGPDGRSCVYIASRNGHLAAVRELLRAKADPGGGDELNQHAMFQNFSPLCGAACGAHAAVLGELLAAKASPDEGALEAAGAWGHADTIRQLLGAKARPEMTGALERAAGAGHLECVATLVAARADVHWGSPLEAACESDRSLPCVLALLRAKARVDHVDDMGEASPLTTAAAAGQLECTCALLRAKAAVDGALSTEKPLVAAAGGGNVRVVRLLLAARAGVNDSAFRGTAAGKTPLIAAARAGHAVVVHELLAAGADLTHYWKQRTAIGHALRAGYKAVASVLLKAAEAATATEGRGGGGVAL